MSMLPESSAQAIIDHLASPPPPAPDYRGRLALLLWELWRDGILSEQQCAKRFAVDLVTMRRVLDMYALRDGHSDRAVAQDEYSQDLYWHALNYRTAAPQHAEAMWQELTACVDRKTSAERERWAHAVAMGDGIANALRREIRYLRHYGNKDCTHMADAALQRGDLEA